MGRLFGRRRGGGGGGSPQVVQQVTSPWAGQAPFLSNIFSRAEQLYTSPASQRTFFPGKTYAPFQPQELDALRLGEARARAGSPIMRAGQEELSKTLGGGYLYGGPGFDAAVDAAMRKVLPLVRSAAPRGRSSSPTARQQEVQALTDVFAGQYGQERQNMMHALSQIPQIANLDYADIAKLASIGEARRDMEQDEIDEQIARHEYKQEQPYQKLRDYQNFIMGNYGNTSESTSFPMRGSRLSGLLGGGLGGAGIGAQIGGPWGAALGGVGGLLAGLF